MSVSEPSPPTLVRTCENCVRAKIRCIRSPGKDDCDRCSRLKKECTFRPARTKHKAERRERRIDVLEARIEQLLASSNRSSPGTTQERSASHERAVSSGASSPANGRVNLKAGDVIDQGILTLDAANALVDSFKRTMMQNMPFVLISKETTGAQLRQEKPFVFLAVLTAALYDNMPMQRRLEQIVKQTISEHAIFGAEITFSFLQGLLIHLAWCQHHSRPRRYTQYIHLAISAISDLRIDRPVELRSLSSRVIVNTDSEWPSIPSREEERALLGVYYFSSNVSQILQKLSPMQYSLYMKQCCESLANNPEYPSDLDVVRIIQLQYLFERMDHPPMQNITDIHSLKSGFENHIRELAAELQAYKATTLPPDLHGSSLLFIQFYTAELYLVQINLFDRRRNQCRPPWTPFRLESLCQGLIAAKTLIDLYMATPLRTEMVFNNAQWIQIGFAITLASKLALASSESEINQQTAEYRDALNMSSIIHQAVLRVQALVTSHIDDRGDRDVYYHYEQRVKHLQWWFEKNISEPPTETPKPCPNGTYPTPSPGFFHDSYGATTVGPTHQNELWADMLIDWMPYSQTSYF